MRIFKNPKKETWKELCKRPEFELEFLESAVKNILTRVKISGDSALIQFTEQFDQVKISDIEVVPQELATAEKRLSFGLKKAINTAASNIEKFHAAQGREIIR